MVCQRGREARAFRRNPFPSWRSYRHNRTHRQPVTYIPIGRDIINFNNNYIIDCRIPEHVEIVAVVIAFLETFSTQRHTWWYATGPAAVGNKVGGPDQATSGAIVIPFH